MHLEITPFQDEHLEDAVGLVAARYRVLREREPSMPSLYEKPEALLPPLKAIAGKFPGVAALQGKRLTGFLTGFVIPDFRWKRSMYSPEFANAAEREGSREIYRQMYAHLSPLWIADGCFTHLVTLMASDPEGIDAWTWSGFGMTAMDAIRDLVPITGDVSRIDIRRAGMEDVDAVTALSHGLRRHLASAPTFLVPNEGALEDEALEKSLADPKTAIWLAVQDSEPVAYMGFGPASATACLITNEEKTTSILGAYVREEVRHGGMGKALLDRGLAWARDAGFERCAVDFEPENVVGSRFWMKHFRPVCTSLIRHIDDRLQSS
ncbi:MAG: GNAT family N-acetyltransferase [Planctomycetota bacterium]|jgi:GNAT superfamily N-acetyltransferase